MHLVAEPGIEHAQDAVDVELVAPPAADPVVLDPGAAAGHLQVEREVLLVLGVDPDEALRRLAHALDDVELISARRGRGSCGCR